jgi:hypothetical protein
LEESSDEVNTIHFRVNQYHFINRPEKYGVRLFKNSRATSEGQLSQTNVLF